MVTASPASWGALGGRVWWDAVSSGRFFTRWTLLASGFIAVAVLSPLVDTGLSAANARALLVSLLVWTLLVVGVLPVAYAERRIRGRALRGLLVIGALVAVSVLRPLLNDAVGELLFGQSGSGAFPQRIATNAMAWLVVLPLVGIATVRHAETRVAGERLAAAVAALERGGTHDPRGESRRLIAETVADLRGRRDALLDGPLDFDAVRGFADEVRAASHRLTEAARGARGSGGAVAHGGDADADADDADTARDQRDSASTPRPGVRLLSRLAPPPLLFIGVLYFFSTVPYALVLGGPVLLGVAFLIIAAIALGADLVTRHLAPTAPSTVRGAIFVATWVVAAVLVTVLGFALHPDVGIVGLIPLVALPAVAIIAALSTDALQRSTAQTRRLTGVLARTAAVRADRTAAAHEDLRRAAALLHGRVQGRCVVFAAWIDDRAPSAAEIAAFRDGVDEALTELLADAPHEGHPDDLDALIETWSGVLHITTEIDDKALAAPAVARQVSTIVGEGFVNAVKHSTARAAHVAVTTAGDRVVVAIRTPGALRPARDAGHGIGLLPGRPRLYQDGAEVALEVLLERTAA